MSAETSDYMVTVQGCDDSTKAVVALTADEREVLNRVAAELNSLSSNSCMPRMAVKPFSDATADDLDHYNDLVARRAESTEDLT